MLIYLYGTIACITLYYIYKPSVNLVKNILTFRTVVKKENPSELEFIRKGAIFIKNLCLYKISEYIYPNIKISESNMYEISYNIGYNNYKILLQQRKRYPKKIIYIQSDDDIDVTNELFSYLGPNEDFHNMKYTPKMLGFRKLSFYNIHDDVKSFEENETIENFV